jgi:hypothetical protein
VPENVAQKEQEKIYSYSQLVELSDKLTLVVGKDEQQQAVIKYFGDVSITISRLICVYEPGYSCRNLIKPINAALMNGYSEFARYTLVESGSKNTE